jgi:hypothetical protein
MFRSDAGMFRSEVSMFKVDASMLKSETSMFKVQARVNKRECRTIDQNILEHISCRRITHVAQRFANIRQHLKANDSTLISIRNI